MNLYNNQSQQIEPFTVGEDIILCMNAIAPYDIIHIGHAFTYCAADILMRYLEMQGCRVTYVQNRGQPLSQDRHELDIKQEHSFSEAMQALNVRPPDKVYNDLSEAVDINISEAQEAENERRPFARFRLHIAMVTHEGEEMSKSGGNLVMVRDLLQYYSADALRLYLAQHHYRQPWSYNEAYLARAAQYVARLKAALTAVSIGTTPINLNPAKNRFVAAMDKDLDTLKGIATLLNVADEIMFRAPNGYRIDEAQTLLRQLSAVFGLRLDAESPEKYAVAGWQEHRKTYFRGTRRASSKRIAVVY